MDIVVDEIYLVNMDKETKRLQDFDKMMTSVHDTTYCWKYIRVPGVNGKALAELNSNICYRDNNDGLQLINCKSTLYHPEDMPKLKQRYINEINWLTLPETGCLLSHVILWEKVANDDNLQRIAIFEDDARTHTDIITINKLLTELYQHFKDNNIPEPDLLYLGKALDDCMNYTHVYGNVYNSTHPLCLHAYIITKSGARKLLEKIPYNAAIDLIPIYEIQNKRLTAMVFHPSIYFQEVLNTTSSLRQKGKSVV